MVVPQLDLQVLFFFFFFFFPFFFFFFPPPPFGVGRRSPGLVPPDPDAPRRARHDRQFADKSRVVNRHADRSDRRPDDRRLFAPPVRCIRTMRPLFSQARLLSVWAVSGSAALHVKRGQNSWRAPELDQCSDRRSAGHTRPRFDRRLTGYTVLRIPADCSWPIRYPAIRPGWRESNAI